MAHSLLLLCHRRRRATAQADFKDYWRDARPRSVTKHQAQLGYQAYFQLSRASRLNILYLAIRASRSWPVVALLSALQGLPVSLPFAARRSGEAERWDLVEIFRYPSLEEMLARLDSAAGAKALAALEADARTVVRHSAGIHGVVRTIDADPALASGRTVTLYCLRVRPPLSRAEMLKHWGTCHASLVQSLKPSLGYRLYDQVHAVDKASKASASSGVEPFDGVALLAYDSEWELVWRLFSPSTQIANLRLVSDEVSFLDHRGAALVHGKQSPV